MIRSYRQTKVVQCNIQIASSLANLEDGHRFQSTSSTRSPTPCSNQHHGDYICTFHPSEPFPHLENMSLHSKQFGIEPNIPLFKFLLRFRNPRPNSRSNNTEPVATWNTRSRHTDFGQTDKSRRLNLKIPRNITVNPPPPANAIPSKVKSKKLIM